MTNVNLRPARPEDADLLLEWVNRADSLAGKIDTKGKIARADHVAWLTRRLADPNSRMFIACVAGVPVGQVRLQAGDDGAAVVDIYVVAEARGQGVAHAAVSHALDDWVHRNGMVRARAVVKRENSRSAALFRALGFSLAAEDAERLVFEIEKTGGDFRA